jgi:Fic family protein
LNRLRTEGVWEAWMEFFLTAVADPADQAVQAARRILAQFEQDRRKVETRGRPAASALRVLLSAQKRPMISAAEAGREAGISRPSAGSAIATTWDLSRSYGPPAKPGLRLRRLPRHPFRRHGAHSITRIR